MASTATGICDCIFRGNSDRWDRSDAGCYVPPTAMIAYYEAVGFNHWTPSPFRLRHIRYRAIDNRASDDLLARRGPALCRFQWQPFAQWALRGRSEENPLWEQDRAR